MIEVMQEHHEDLEVVDMSDVQPSYGGRGGSLGGRGRGGRGVGRGGRRRGTGDYESATKAKFIAETTKAMTAQVKKKMAKLLNKRALQNEDLYKNLNKEISEMVSKMSKTEIAKIEKDNADLIKELGNCPLTKKNVMQALNSSDCMCIGISIQPAEAAIADPSRLVIGDIFPTYVTADNFLKIASLKAKRHASGGFDKMKTALQGAIPDNEKITGIMPLYLFEQHWKIVQKKLQPIFGFMCSLDTLGYIKEQLYTIPFLVLLKAFDKANSDPSEVNQRMLELVTQTCMAVVESNPEFRNELIEQFIKFCRQPPGVSSRTQDVVKSIPVFTA